MNSDTSQFIEDLRSQTFCTQDNGKFLPENSIGFLLITPEIASRLISLNKKNRNIRPGFVDQLAQMILEDRWVIRNCDCIGICDDGYILNGQHRLHAVVKAQKAIVAPVMFDIPAEARIYIDSGRNRTPTDAVRIATGKNHYTRLVSSAVRLIVVNGKELDRKQIVEFACHYEEQIRKVNDMFKGSPKFIQLPANYAAVFLALVRGVNESDLERFMQVLLKGRVSEDRDETVLSLRDILSYEATKAVGTKRVDTNSAVMRTQMVIENYIRNRTVNRTYTPKDYKWSRISKEEFLKETT